MSDESPAMQRAAASPKMTLARARAPLADPAAQLQLLEAQTLVSSPRTAAALPAANVTFDAALAAADRPPLRALGVEVLQVNVGKRCNQTCSHCHVDAGPERTESMSHATAAACIDVLRRHPIPTLDITGGAPELSPEFEYLVREARALGRHVIDRCNLTILLTKPHAHLIEFLAEHQVEVVCSLPHYRQLGTDRQRGAGVYDASIEALRRLNAVGYGRDPRLALTIVTNPVGAFLPAGQTSLEAEWKAALARDHGLVFGQLHTITNMPISRYLEWLETSGNLRRYMQRLVDAFNPVAADGVMCRTMVSVGWDGRLFDCDFNQMLEMPVHREASQRIETFDLARLAERRIETARHCFGCTAGAGSSCGGQLAT